MNFAELQSAIHNDLMVFYLQQASIHKGRSPSRESGRGRPQPSPAMRRRSSRRRSSANSRHSRAAALRSAPHRGRCKADWGSEWSDYAAGGTARALTSTAA